MEEKKKINLITALLVLIVIMLITVASLMYVEIQNTKAEMKKLSERISNLEQANMQENTESNNSEEEIKKEDSNNKEENKYEEITEELKGIDVFCVTEAINNNGTYTLRGVIYSEYTISSEEYEKIVDEGKMQLDGETYIVKNGELYSSSESEYPDYKIEQLNSGEYYLGRQAQISDVWQLTDEYKEITLANDIIIEDEYTEEQITTVGERFKDFKGSEPIETIQPEGVYRFEFENGKCTKVIDALTSI